jgi:glycyl-tRNA synthetase beta chain
MSHVSETTGDLLLELFSEEIPARLQDTASLALKTLAIRLLEDNCLSYTEAHAFATPRRLTLYIKGIPHTQPEQREERRGPRLGCPPQALEGFLKSVGLSDPCNLKILKDPKKGDFYSADLVHPSRTTIDLLAESLPSHLERFPWPKSMRWGSDSAEKTALRWIRPLHAIVCTFSSAHRKKTSLIPFQLGSLSSGQKTYGHRFLAPQSIHVNTFGAYKDSLEESYVLLDPQERKNRIWHQAQTCAQAQGLDIIEDEKLLQEVAGLVEWPCVFMGRFNANFLRLPTEVIRLTARYHQKCFLLKDSSSPLSSPNDSCTNAFILVANHSGTDGGKTIVAGNERVISARLHDALFFWESDLKESLETHLERLNPIIFHDKLGSQSQRIARIADLARRFSEYTGADPVLAERAGRLAKADLTTRIVGEFPELQGIMGGLYARHWKEPEAVCEAIRTHYKPQGPSDSVPQEPISVSVALADKCDLLSSFWWAGEKPSGTRDPYALRRTALGFIRLILTHNLSFSWSEFARVTWSHLGTCPTASHDRLLGELRVFLNDRLSVYLEDTEKWRYDIIRAVMESESAQHNDNIIALVATVRTVAHFLSTPEGSDLLALYRRATHILEGEEKRDQMIYGRPLDALSCADMTEADHALYDTLTTLQGCTNLEGKSSLNTILQAIAQIRPAVDHFFDTVLINDPDPKIRIFRLELLSAIRSFCHKVADFSKIVG